MYCFWHWVNIAKAMNVDLYVLCDKDEIKELIFRQDPSCKFISSARERLNLICKDRKDLISPQWLNTSYALLTPFIHAKDNGFESFWNIDADDTMFYAEASLVAEVMKQVELYANDVELDCLSLDMWYTWTFGVTYIRNSCNYMWILEEVLKLQDELNFRPHFPNIDAIFERLRQQKYINAKRFVVENMWFEHLNNWANTWKDGYIQAVYLNPKTNYRKHRTKYSEDFVTISCNTAVSSFETKQTIIVGLRGKEDA
jgi:hypothetical protein